MVRVITVNDIKQLINALGFEKFMCGLIDVMRDDFANWHGFQKVPRHATHLEHGVLELMPICGPDYFAFKFVNGHPQNPLQGKQTVVATGMLVDVATGYPLMISEMTILTAVRTAATSALAASYLARNDSHCLGIVGTGSQSEFQVLAHAAILPIKRVQYFDLDARAMQKFERNMQRSDIELHACHDAYESIKDADVIITMTAAKQHVRILENDWIMAGTHINGIGGDCPGKTELDPLILKRSKNVVEYIEQSLVEGEVQHYDESHIYAELWEIVQGVKLGRENSQEITLFDSVGFALEDYSVLKYVYRLAEKMGVGEIANLIPDIKDPKDLFGEML